MKYTDENSDFDHGIIEPIQERRLIQYASIDSGHAVKDNPYHLQLPLNTSAHV